MNETIVKTEKLTELKNLVREIEEIEDLNVLTMDYEDYNSLINYRKKLYELIKTL